MIAMMDKNLENRRVVIDPNVLDTQGKTAIDWFVPSLDGKRVAVSLSKGGSEERHTSVLRNRDGQTAAGHH